MGRDTTADRTPLLTDAEQNIGNSDQLNPEAGSSGTILAQSAPPRILQLARGGSAAGQTVSVVLTASRIAGPNNPNPGFAGPVTAVIEFGNGGRSTRAEVDVPFGPFLGFNNGVLSATEPQDGGVIVTVPTGVVRVYMRYDNLYIQPLINVSPPISFAQAKGVPLMGPGGNQLRGVPAEPVLVKAMAAYFSRHYAKAYRTQYCFVSPTGAAGIQTVGTVVGPNIVPYNYSIPAFARSVKVLRYPNTAALVVTLYDSVNLALDDIAIPSGTSPTIPIIGTEVVLGIASASAGAGDQVSMLALSYEIGI